MCVGSTGIWTRCGDVAIARSERGRDTDVQMESLGRAAVTLGGHSASHT